MLRDGSHELWRVTVWRNDPYCPNEGNASCRSLNHTAHGVFLPKFRIRPNFGILGSGEQQQLLEQFLPAVLIEPQRCEVFGFRTTNGMFKGKQVVANLGDIDNRLLGMWQLYSKVLAGWCAELQLAPRLRTRNSSVTLST